MHHLRQLPAVAPLRTKRDPGNSALITFVVLCADYANRLNIYIYIKWETQNFQDTIIFLFFTLVIFTTGCVQHPVTEKLHVHPLLSIPPKVAKNADSES